LGKAEPKQLLEKVVQNPTFGKGGAKPDFFGYTFSKGVFGKSCAKYASFLFDALATPLTF
jgi:hypothetical protein